MNRLITQHKIPSTMSLPDLRQLGFEGGVRIRELQVAARYGAAEFLCHQCAGSMWSFVRGVAW